MPPTMPGHDDMIKQGLDQIDQILQQLLSQMDPSDERADRLAGIQRDVTVMAAGGNEPMGPERSMLYDSEEKQFPGQDMPSSNEPGLSGADSISDGPPPAMR